MMGGPGGMPIPGSSPGSEGSGGNPMFGNFGGSPDGSDAASSAAAAAAAHAHAHAHAQAGGALRAISRLTLNLVFLLAVV